MVYAFNLERIFTHIHLCGSCRNPFSVHITERVQRYGVSCSGALVEHLPVATNKTKIQTNTTLLNTRFPPVLVLTARMTGAQTRLYDVSFHGKLR